MIINCIKKYLIKIKRANLHTTIIILNKLITHSVSEFTLPYSWFRYCSKYPTNTPKY